MGLTKYNWNGEKIRKLRKELGCSQKEVALKAGVSEGAYCKYEQGNTIPGFQALIRLSDFYAVPIDYLLGRTEYANAEDLFKEKINELEKNSALDTIKKTIMVPDVQGMNVPYPYNLFNAIFGRKNEFKIMINEDQRKNIDVILSELDKGKASYINDFFYASDEIVITNEHIKGLEKAILSLTNKEQKVLKLRFKDGKTLEECAPHFNVSRERVRQIEAEAIKKLRHPSLRKYYEFGLSDVINEADKYEEELERLNKVIEDVNEAESTIAGLKIILENKKKKEANIKIEVLNLSRRSYFSLKRANINTIGDLTKLTADEIMNIRNIGKTSFNEILEKLAERGFILANKAIGA